MVHTFHRHEGAVEHFGRAESQINVQAVEYFGRAERQTSVQAVECFGRAEILQAKRVAFGRGTRGLWRQGPGSRRTPAPRRKFIEGKPAGAP